MPVSNLPQSSDNGQNSDGVISDFRISGQSLIKRNYYNSRNREDSDMKLGPVTKFDKINKTMPGKFGGDVILKYCEVIAMFLIYD